jgi:hypothetical protein
MMNPPLIVHGRSQDSAHLRIRHADRIERDWGFEEDDAVRLREVSTMRTGEFHV